MIDRIQLPPFPRGSDIRIPVTLRHPPVGGDPPEPVNLTGRDLVVFDVSPGLQGRVTVAMVDAAAGHIEFFIQGTDPIAIGQHDYRLQIVGNGMDSKAHPRYIVPVI